MLKEKILFWINAVFYIVFGFIMIFNPNLALETIIIVFWIESILSWIAGTVLSIHDEDFEDRWILSGISIFQILVWVLLIFFPKFGETILKIFIVLIWIWIIIKWILVIINSFNIKKVWLRKWWWVLVAGCLLTLLWLFLVIYSSVAISITISIIGLWLIISGISMIIWVLQLKKLLKD